MFGYVRPLICELKVREQTLYRAYYCGLCRTIGQRCGQAARLTLNYDLTFLAMLAAAFEPPVSCRPGGCFYKPLKGKRPIAPPSRALDYAADANVLLVYNQLRDTQRDEKRADAFFAASALLPALRRTENKRPELARAIYDGIARLSEIEKSQTKLTDAPADAFACLMRDMIGLYPYLPETERRPAEWMFYNLGRWIYLADAWEDREKDRKHGAYNVFNLAGTGKEEASFLLYVSLTEAENGYELLNLQGDTGILDNIMRLGCRDKTKKLLEGEAHESV